MTPSADIATDDPMPGRAPITHGRILAAVDGFAEGLDAATLGRLIGQAVGADLILVTVYAHPLVPVPPGLGTRALQREGLRILNKVRDRTGRAPGSR